MCSHCWARWGSRLAGSCFTSCICSCGALAGAAVGGGKHCFLAPERPRPGLAPASRTCSRCLGEPWNKSPGLPGPTSKLAHEPASSARKLALPGQASLGARKCPVWFGGQPGSHPCRAECTRWGGGTQATGQGLAEFPAGGVWGGSEGRATHGNPTTQAEMVGWPVPSPCSLPRRQAQVTSCWGLSSAGPASFTVYPKSQRSCLPRCWQGARRSSGRIRCHAQGQWTLLLSHAQEEVPGNDPDPPVGWRPPGGSCGVPRGPWRLCVEGSASRGAAREEGRP